MILQISNSCGNTATEISANNKEDTQTRLDLGLELNWIGFGFGFLVFVFWDGVWVSVLGPRLRSIENNRTRVCRAKCRLESE